MNAAVWLATPLAEGVAYRAAVVIVGALVLLFSGCLIMYWKRDVDEIFATFVDEMRERPRAPAPAVGPGGAAAVGPQTDAAALVAGTKL